MTDEGKRRGPAELTIRSITVGIAIGILFGAANAYLGLKVGLTVSASVPAAVMAVAIFRALKRAGVMGEAGILESNMVQTIGSAGESLAAGVIFTVPALVLLGFSPGVLKIFVLGALGGVLGILFMAPLRHYLIVKERDKLVYPEGTACASVLSAGREKGTGGGLIFSGLAVGAAYEFLVNGVRMWKSTPAWEVPGLRATEVSAESSPALLGVGYVIGPRIAAIMFGGGALAWLVLIPAIKLFGGVDGAAVYPATVPIAELDAHGVWHNYVRYIGAGAVVFGGIVTLVRSLPVIVSSARSVLGGLKSGELRRDEESSGRDLPGWFIIGGIALIVVLMAALPGSMAPGDLPSALLAVLFAFFFVTVSSRIVGLIGSSSNPVSGMTIAALLATSLVFKLFGWADADHQSAALAVGAIVCISAAIAGDTSQDLKTGYLVGATPWRQQAGEIVGVLTSAAVIGIVVLRLHQAYGFGSATLPAPQATLMSLVVKGVLSGELPWGLVFMGVFMAAVIELLGIPSLPFAVGLYLPLSMSSPIMLGGLVRAVIQRKRAREEGAELDKETGLLSDRGVLFASGLIAGSAFLGMTMGIMRSFDSTRQFVDRLDLGSVLALGEGNLIGAAALAALAALLFRTGRKSEGG